MIPRASLVLAALLVPLLAGPAAGGGSTERAGRRAATVEHHGERFETRRAIGSRRGRPVELVLVTIGWIELELRTARAFLAMRAAAARDGVTLRVRSGFRDRETQAWLYRAWRAGYGHKAARPGHSAHESGRALDLRVHEPRTRAWLRRHARRFGFHATVRSEPWHWEHTRGARR